MVHVVILYPNQPGGRFDHKYYAEMHVPMVEERLRPLGLRSIESTRVVDSYEKSERPAYVAITHLVFDTEGEFRRAFGLTLDELSEDVRNYTNIQSEIIVTEVTAQIVNGQ